MQIIRDKFYLEQLENILDYIAKDSPNKAFNFLNELDYHISNLVFMPYKFRKSFYYDDENIRDLVFKGYTIPYYIDKKNDIILILDIFKWNKK